MTENEKYFARDQQGHVIRDPNGTPTLDEPKAIKSALSYMTDKAAIWARPHIEKIANAQPAFNNSWNQFLTEYKLKFNQSTRKLKPRNKSGFCAKGIVCLALSFRTSKCGLSAPAGTGRIGQTT